MRNKYIFLFLFLLISLSLKAEDNVIAFNRKWELPVFISLSSAWLTVEVASKFEGPSQCRWCPVDANGNPVENAFDVKFRKFLRWGSHRGLADTLSDVCGNVILPLSAGIYIYFSEREKSTPQSLKAYFLVGESFIFTGILTHITKYSFLRRRPYAHFGGEEERRDPSANLSFISGHASLSFSIAASTSIISLKRNYPSPAPLILSFFSLALFSSYFRIAADKHYITDVIAGAAVGASAGAINTILHFNKKAEGKFALFSDFEKIYFLYKF